MTSKIIITGKSGSGKTSFCAAVVNAMRQGDLKRMDIRGVLSPALRRGGEKVGIQAVNLVTFEHKNLAERNDGDPGAVSTKRWKFDPKVIAWCNSILANATPCTVLILDEIGPLEFKQGEGFIAGLEAVDIGDYELSLVVVRPHLLDRARERWPGAEVINVQELQDEGTAIKAIVQRVAG
jgi:nucleoside-triphosphatase THEP1